MLIGYKRGQGSIVLRVKLLDSSVTTGAGKTGLTSASSGLIISTIADNEASATAYTVAGSAIETITTLGTFAAPTATKCRFKEVDATNHKGIYEIQIADARFAVSSAKSLLVSVSGVSNVAETDVCIPLRDLDPYDSVRAGLTGIPNVAAGASGGLPLSVDASGRVDVLKINGTSQTARDIGASVLLSSGTGTGQLDFTSGVVKANATQWLGGTIPAVNVTGVPLIDVKYLLGTAWSTPTVAGIPNVNVKTWNDLTTVALPLVPTTAGRTLDVSTGGEAGLDWANVGSPTTTVGLSGTTVKTATDVATDTAAIKLKTDNLPSSPAAIGSAMTLTSGAIDLIHDETFEGSISMRMLHRGILAFLAAKCSGMEPGGTPTIRDYLDTKVRIQVTADKHGNRSAILTVDLT